MGQVTLNSSLLLFLAPEGEISKLNITLILPANKPSLIAFTSLLSSLSVWKLFCAKFLVHYSRKFQLTLNSISQIDITQKLAFSNKASGTSLVVQWVRLHVPSAGGQDSIPGRGTRSPMHTTTKKSECRK